MTQKTLIIHYCADCPYFDNEYYDWAAKCDKLDRKIDSGQRGNWPIPDDCPLGDTHDTAGDYPVTE